MYLTNDWHFWYMNGHVIRFESPPSYFSLQDPWWIDEFVGPVNVSAEDALAYARKVILQLKGTNIENILARHHKIVGPINTQVSVVPRYRIQWPRAATEDEHATPDTEIDIEIDASTKSIQMLSLIASRNFYQPPPKVDVIPELLQLPQPALPSCGIQLNPVSPTYFNALLAAVLPVFTDYARKLELPIELPITTDSIKYGPLTGVHELYGLPSAQVELTNGYGFRFEYGYVRTFAAFYEAAFGPLSTNKPEDLIGPINMTADEVIESGYATLRKLGYTEKEIPILAKRPFVNKDNTAPP